MQAKRVDIVTVVVDVGRYMDGALDEVDRYVIEVPVRDQLELGQVQLLGVRIRPLQTHTRTPTQTQIFLLHKVLKCAAVKYRL